MRERLLKVIGGIHDAGFDHSLWDGVLGDVAALFGGHIGTLQQLDPSSMAVAIEAQSGLDPEVGRLYAERYSIADPWINAIAPQYGPGEASTGAMNFPFAELKQTAVYNKIYKTLDVVDCLISMIDKRPDSWSYLTVYRPSSRGFFSPDDVVLAQTLIRHVRSAFVAHDWLCLKEGELRNREDALHALDIPVFLLARNGRVLFSNAAADKFLAGATPFAIFHGELVLADGAARGALAGALASPLAPLSFAVPRGDGLLPWIVHGSAISADAVRAILPQADDAALLIAVTDPLLEPGSKASVLVATFGLTQAEAQIACDIASGTSVEEIAVASGRSRETVRTHVKSLFIKTGASRQPELAAALTRAFPPFIRR